jgi:hypothetical protein
MNAEEARIMSLRNAKERADRVLHQIALQTHEGKFSIQTKLSESEIEILIGLGYQVSTEHLFIEGPNLYRVSWAYPVTGIITNYKPTE